MAVTVAGEVAPEVRAEITGQPAVTRLEIVRFN
jgi:hypothetical protein